MTSQGQEASQGEKPAFQGTVEYPFPHPGTDPKNLVQGEPGFLVESRKINLSHFVISPQTNLSARLWEPHAPAP